MLLQVSGFWLVGGLGVMLPQLYSYVVLCHNDSVIIIFTDTPTVVESSSTPPLILEGKPHLPFQLQTEYTTTDGSVLVRVITKVKPVTEDRQLAEKGKSSMSVCTRLLFHYRGGVSTLTDIDMDVMGFHVLRTSANLAAEGKFTEARTGAIASQRMMKRSLERSG